MARHLRPPLAYDVERVLRAALTGPAEPGADFGLDILDAGDEPAGRTARRSTAHQPGRHKRGPAGGRRIVSAVGRNVRSALIADVAATAAAAAAGTALRPDGAVVLPVLLLSPALVVSLGLSGAYKRRVLSAGVAEYGRVVRGGLGLIGAVAPAAVLAPTMLPWSYVLAVLPAATVGAVAGRILVRWWRRSGEARLSGAAPGGRPRRR